MESMCFDEIESQLKITISLGATLFRIREKADDMIERADSQLIGQNRWVEIKRLIMGEL